MSLTEEDLRDINLSGDDTISQAATTPLARSEGSPCDTDFESDSEDVLIASRSGGDCADFQVHIKSWRWHLETDSAQESSVLGDSLSTSWTACMLLWIRFAHDATLDQRLRDKWQDATNNPNQDLLLSILTECLESSGTTHPRWSPAESCECRKEHAAGISFTDAVVEHALRGNENAKQKWRENVVQNWFRTDEPSSAFLSRANKFLRDAEHSSKGMSIFESLVETQSYVVFIKMIGLAASLLFGYLEACKLDFASATGAAGGGGTLLFHGFTSFVSSEGQAFSLSKTMTCKTGMPALHVIVQGLQGMVHLAHTCCKVMGPVKTAQEFLERDRNVSREMSGVGLGFRVRSAGRTGKVCDTRSLQTKGFAFIKPDTGDDFGSVHAARTHTKHLMSSPSHLTRYFHPFRSGKGNKNAQGLANGQAVKYTEGRNEKGWQRKMTAPQQVCARSNFRVYERERERTLERTRAHPRAHKWCNNQTYIFNLAAAD
jgi:hypothetical protein